MGYMTTICFLNDAAGAIEKNPEEVVRNILSAMNNSSEQSKTYSIGNFGNPMQSMKTGHADEPRVYLTYGNSIIGFGWNSNVENLEYRKKSLKMAKELLKEEERKIKELEEKQNAN